MGFVTVAEKLAQKGFRVTEHEIALAKRMDQASLEALMGAENVSAASRKTMRDGYTAFLEAAPGGTNKYEALRIYMAEARHAFPEGEVGDKAFKKFRAVMSDEVRRKEGLEPKANKGIEQTHDEDKYEAREIRRDQRNAKKAAEDAALKAEATIQNSLVDMDIVRQSNGKMPKETFFAELQNALATKSRLVQKIDRDALTSPKDIYAELEAGGKITTKEFSTLGLYFKRYHDDPKLASQAGAQSSNTPLVQNARGMASVADTIIRKIPISEGKRTTSTIAQEFAWENGSKPSFLLNQASAYQEKPVRTLLSHGAMAFAAWAGVSTFNSYQDFQEPSYLGREILAVVTPDKQKDVSDFAEFVHARYNGKPEVAMTDLKKYYGIEKLDDAHADQTVNSLLRGPQPNPPYSMPSPDVTQGLILYVSQKLYGKEVATTEDLKDLQNKQIKKKQEFADAQKANDEAIINANQQGAIEHGIPTTLFTGKSRAATPVYEEIEDYAPVELEDFTNRAKGVLYNNPEMQQALSKKFVELAGQDKAMDGQETELFQENANEMLQQAGFSAEKAKRTVSFLLGNNL